MKTFEERYTAWIDGQLSGNALTSFEQELASRAEAGDAAAEVDKADALQLRALLKEHLQAPVLDNTEFFSHQMRERIDVEISKAAARREATARPAWKFPAFAWPFARVAGAGLACLFVAGALYYGMVPQHPDADKVAKGKLAPQVVPAPETQVVESGTPVPQPPSADRPGKTDLALQNHPTPAPLDDDLPQVRIITPSVGKSTSVTPLQFGNTSVIWVDGLTYLPGVANGTASPAPAPNNAPAPTGSPAPVATP